ncbi:GNAT family N-acetyltransferase [Paenibacillus tyrfis]|uniref:GNAT family N-acetyltransferase n=1 Tax=Paenibacillus tyrfis TaxID=1501230 RepID=UPI0020A127C4|nr:GNAT family N-acetyltransferase [Paenibacillus tyrfis]MCP1311039.1 GNAT family N-acetyltransferase [Paenibacillus tyrfis]
MDADPDDYEEFLDPVRRGSRYYSVYTDSGLMGFFSFTPQEQEAIEIGLGMAPGCTGKGQGAACVREGMALAEKAGFVQTETFVQQTNGGSYDFIRMVKKANRAAPL